MGLLKSNYNSWSIVLIRKWVVVSGDKGGTVHSKKNLSSHILLNWENKAHFNEENLKYNIVIIFQMHILESVNNALHLHYHFAFRL